MGRIIDENATRDCTLVKDMVQVGAEVKTGERDPSKVQQTKGQTRLCVKALEWQTWRRGPRTRSRSRPIPTMANIVYV